METSIRAPKRKQGQPAPSLHERVGRIELKAQDELDELKLAILASVLTPISGKKKDKMFDRWMLNRILAYLKKNKLTIHVDGKPLGAK